MTANILLKGARTRVYNRTGTFFWRDPWLGETPLINHTRRELTMVESYKLVKDFWEPNKGWKWENLDGVLPSHLENLLAAILVRSDDEDNDSLCWSPIENGELKKK